MPGAVIEAISEYYRTCNANHDGQFVTSLESDAMIERARDVVATFLGAAGPDTISFGANMTTLNFSLSHALVRGWKPGDEVVITALDHEANRGAWLRLTPTGAPSSRARARAAFPASLPKRCAPKRLGTPRETISASSGATRSGSDSSRTTSWKRFPRSWPVRSLWG